MKFKYFTYDEFDCPSLKGSGKKTSDELINMLDIVRKKYGKSITINSGYRTPERNEDPVAPTNPTVVLADMLMSIFFNDVRAALG